MKRIEVVAAIIIHEKKILCVQRGENKFAYISNKYEFPGGKLEIGESHSEAITREIKEELLIDIDVIEPFLTNEHNYADFSITMHSLICHSDSKDITLTEHIECKWLAVDEMDALNWAGADVPILEKLKGVNIERAFT
jgi:8-oxo-dGTP diphosphatase